MEPIILQVVALVVILGALGLFAYDDIKTRKLREPEERQRPSTSRRSSRERDETAEKDEDTH